MAYRELLLGCGFRRDKQVKPQGRENWENLTTLDCNAECKPDVIWDLDCSLPLPFANDYFDEIHAYDVLEHVGRQGDFIGFFSEFGQYWRILKPAGLFCAITPQCSGLWTWGDPGHRRVFNRGTLTFLQRRMYDQIGRTAMSDYRSLRGETDFMPVYLEEREESFIWILQAFKNRARCLD